MNETPYQKLAITPLALKHNVLGLHPKIMTLILGVVSLLIDPIPTYLLIFKLFMEFKPRERDPAFNDPFFDKHRKSSESMEKIPLYVLGAMGIIASTIHVIAIIVLLIGAVKSNGRYYYCWFCTVSCHILMGKLGFTAFLFVLGHSNLAPIPLIMIVLDIPLIILMMYCLGQTFALERNSRFASQGMIKYNIEANTMNQQSMESGQAMLAPRNYPRQQNV